MKDERSAYQLGVAAQEGDVSAVNELKKRVEAAKPASRDLNALGYCYHNGYGGLQKDTVRAQFYYQLAESLGNVDALYNLGLIAENSKKPDLATQYHYRACSNPAAIGRVKHPAYRELKHLAKTGVRLAQVCVSLCYEYGHVVKKNDRKAVKWYEHAAKAGDCGAMIKIGEANLRGIGVIRNIKTAKSWLMLAASTNVAVEDGDLQVMKLLEELYQLDMSDFEVCDKLIYCYKNYPNRYDNNRLQQLYTDKIDSCYQAMQTIPLPRNLTSLTNDFYTNYNELFELHIAELKSHLLHIKNNAQLTHESKKKEMKKVKATIRYLEELQSSPRRGKLDDDLIRQLKQDGSIVSTNIQRYLKRDMKIRDLKVRLKNVLSVIESEAKVPRDIWFIFFYKGLSDTAKDMIRLISRSRTTPTRITDLYRSIMDLVQPGGRFLDDKAVRSKEVTAFYEQSYHKLKNCTFHTETPVSQYKQILGSTQTVMQTLTDVPAAHSQVSSEFRNIDGLMAQTTSTIKAETVAIPTAQQIAKSYEDVAANDWQQRIEPRVEALSRALREQWEQIGTNDSIPALETVDVEEVNQIEETSSNSKQKIMVRC